MEILWLRSRWSDKERLTWQVTGAKTKAARSGGRPTNFRLDNKKTTSTKREMCGVRTTITDRGLSGAKRCDAFNLMRCSSLRGIHSRAMESQLIVLNNCRLEQVYSHITSIYYIIYSILFFLSSGLSIPGGFQSSWML